MTAQPVNLLDRIANFLPSASKTVALDLTDTTILKQDLVNFRNSIQPLSKSFLVSYNDPSTGEQKQAWVFSGSYTRHTLCVLYETWPNYHEVPGFIHCLYVRDGKSLIYPTFYKPPVVRPGDSKFKVLMKMLNDERAVAYEKYDSVVGHDRFYVCSPRLIVTEDKVTVIFTSCVQGEINSSLTLHGMSFDVEKSEDALIDYLKGCGSVEQQLVGLSTYRQIVGHKHFDKYMNFFINHRDKLS